MAGRSRRWWFRLLAAVWTGAVLLPAPAAGDVVRVVVDRREPLLGGRAFGPAGAYEMLVGRILFAFDPARPANAGVVDLDLAPRNAEGKVEVWADFVVLQPLDPAGRRGIAWVDVGAGGAGASLRLIHGATGIVPDPSSEAELGDALLLREGLTVIQVGWESAPVSAPGGLAIQLPTAREADGSPVMGWVRLDWVVESPTERLLLAPEGRHPHPVVVPEAPVHVLTVRDGPYAERDTLPRDAWDFVEAPDGRDAGRPVAIALDGGFEAGRIYELVYRAQDPRVTGVGLAVVRDVMAYARYDLRSVFPANRGVAFGAGMGARFLRQFLREGFNVDENGRPVFDAVWMHGAGAARGSFNTRFAQPERVPGPLQDFHYPVDLFPFSLASQFDPVLGREEGLVDRLPPPARPRTFTTHLGYDYWARAAALTHTSVDGFRDLGLDGPDRAWHLASTGPLEATPGGAEGMPPADSRWTVRALARALVAWVADGTPPPPSRLPRVGDGTLVPARGVAYPVGEALPPPPPPHLAERPDYGARFDTAGIIDREPPLAGPAFPVQVPQVDGVGNELGGIRGLDVRVPLATYLSWDIRREGPFAGEALSDAARAVPLPLTDVAAESDGRPTLQRLYGSEAGFLARVRAAAAALVAEGFLLEEDREAAIAAARDRWLRITVR